jgi:hypothetical protein
VRRLAVPLLVLAVLGGTVAAFAITESRKLEQAPAVPRAWAQRIVAPTCACALGVIELPVAFRARDRVTVRLVDASGDTVRTLVRRQAVRPGVVTFAWDGRSDGGEPLPDGAYRLELALVRADRTLRFPARLRVDTTPPPAPELLRPRGPVELTPDGDGAAERVWVRYRSSARARAELVVGGEVVRLGQPKPPGRHAIDWSGQIGALVAPPGDYTLALRLVEPAGNRSAEVRVPTVTIRGLGLRDRELEVARGGELAFALATGRTPYGWTLVRVRDGRTVLSAAVEHRRSVTVGLPERIAPGRYELRLTRARDEVTATVVVTRRP